MLIAHLDFKGMVPRATHFLQLLQDIAALGFDGILVEYEDIFPFACVNLAAAPATRWSKRTLQAFLAEAARLNLEVIPLQQCLGHLEYVYHLEEWRAFTLDADYPSMVDITNPAAKAHLFDLLDQMIAAHDGSRFVHVGMDEAYGLIGYARDNGLDAIDLFLDHLEEICAVCEARGVTPIIWSDMLEDFFNPAALQRFDSFKDRVVLCTWDYQTTGADTATARIAGNRVSREWLAEPHNPQAPPMDGGTKFIEELAEDARAALVPFQRERWFQSPFWCDLWMSRGFRVLGASAARTAEDGAVLPFLNLRRANIRAWEATAARCDALGTVVTSWARSTTWFPPLSPFDLTWPLLEEAARAAGKKPSPFFAGIDVATIEGILSTLGRCREDWHLETAIADEMDALAPQLTRHRYEWQMLALMARVLAWQRRASNAQFYVDTFAASDRLIAADWKRRILELTQIEQEGKALQRTLKKHFFVRYHRDAVEEWLRDLFTAPQRNLRAGIEICRAKSQK